MLQGVVPTDGQAIAGLALRDAGHVVGRIVAPRHLPRVTVRRPRVSSTASALTLHWRTIDPDKGRWTVFVALKGRHGRYLTLWEGFDRGVATIPVSALRVGRDTLRVSVSNGFRTGAGSVTFTVPKRAVKHARRAGIAGWQRALAKVGIQVVP